MHDHLWAPWRLSFVEGKAEKPAILPGPTGCIFCDYPRPYNAAPDLEHDKQRLVVHAREHAFVILNKYPYNNGHVMVVPRHHGGAIELLPDASFLGLNALLKDTIAAVKEAYKPDGLNMGMNVGRAGGAGIADHVHWHIVPRWSGDVNFMPVLADARVISESLEASFDRLKAVMG